MRSIPGSVKALAWLRKHESVTGGIVARSGQRVGNLAITGALLPALVRFGEKNQARRCAAWLMGIQRPDGSFAQEGRELSISETSQVLHGMLAVPQLVPGIVNSARRAAEYACERIFGLMSGRTLVPLDSSSHHIQLSTLRYLREAVSILKNVKHQNVVESGLQQLLRNGAPQTATSTDFLAEDLDALLDLGKPALARPKLDEIAGRQRASGWIPAKRGALWLSSVGLAHLSVCWYKIGQFKQANRALAWLDRHQLSSGGLVGRYGWTAPWSATAEDTWALKWYLDAHYLRMRSLMERDVCLSDVCLSDERVQALAGLIVPGDRVLEVGCGLGRFLKAIRSIYSDVYCTGVDITRELLARIPSDIETHEGALDRVPFPDDSFDVVFSVEALERCRNAEAVIKELSRVTRPGGWVALVDKHKPAEVVTRLGQYCDRVSCQSLGYDNRVADGLTMMWVGRKLAAHTMSLRQYAS
jgi:malonyl-CoA O-methyltransferase